MPMIVRMVKNSGTTTISIPPFVVPTGDPEVHRDFRPTNWSIKRAQDNTGSWSFSVPFAEAYDPDLFESESIIYFYLDDEEVMHGFADEVNVTMSNGQAMYTLAGLGEVEELSRILSRNQAHYQDMPVVAILTDILVWAGWALGDFSTMLDRNVQTTVDLREKETVLEQVQVVCSSIPGLHWRWGGYDGCGRKLLDIGYFGEDSGYHLTQAPITTVTVQPTPESREGYIGDVTKRKVFTGLISEVHGSGGTFELSGTQKIVNLWFVAQLFSASPQWELPDFPLVQDSWGYYRVRNSNVYPDGKNIRKVWDYLVTKNDGTTTYAEVVAASLGLYNKCVRFLQEHESYSTTYTTTIVGLHAFSPPCDTVRIDANFLKVVTDAGGGILLPNESIHEDLRVQSWSMQGDSAGGITINVTLSPDEFVEPYDVEHEVTQFLAKARTITNRRGGMIAGDYGDDSVLNYVDTGSGASDCSGCDGDGIEITIAFTPPGGATRVQLLGFMPDPAESYTIDVTQYPVVSPYTPAIICFQWKDRDWLDTDTVSLTTYLRFD